MVVVVGESARGATGGTAELSSSAFPNLPVTAVTPTFPQDTTPFCVIGTNIGR